MNDDIIATMHLATDQISTSRTTTDVSNPIGGWSNGRKEFWFNVKLRNLLGDAYDKYDTFLISLVHEWIVNSATLNVGRGLQLQMGGLQWINSSYDQALQANNYWATLPTALIGAGASATGNAIYDNQSACYVFKKSSAQETIYFRYLDVKTNATPANVTLLPNAQLIFKIQPIKSTF